MKKLQRALRREHYMQLFAALLLLLGGALVVYFCFGKNIPGVIFGLLLLLLGLRFGYQSRWPRNLEDERLLRLLCEHPRQIVWVYSVVTELMPFGFRLFHRGVLFFKLANGDDISVTVPARDLKLISHFLNRVLPHASFGYSPDRERQFQADPNLLLRR